MDATFFHRETASMHYCRRTNYRIQTVKTIPLIDTKTQAVLDVHYTTEKRHGTQIGWQLVRHNVDEIVASLPTKATIGRDYVRNCAKTPLDR